MALGWQPTTSFDDGLRITVDWYRKFGEVWWGDISRVLTSFPVVDGNEIWTKEEHEDLSSSDAETGLEASRVSSTEIEADRWGVASDTIKAGGLHKGP